MQGYHARRKAALPVLYCLENELENVVAWLTGKELEVLLRWKDVPVSKIGNVANRRVLYQQFTDGGEEENNAARDVEQHVDSGGVESAESGCHREGER